jgi:hypothetical protein
VFLAEALVGCDQSVVAAGKASSKQGMQLRETLCLLSIGWVGMGN